MSIPLLSDKVYQFAYVLKNDNNLYIEPPLFNYLEALAIMQAFTITNITAGLTEEIADLEWTADIKSVKTIIINKKGVTNGFGRSGFGIYTQSEATAAKLAFATGAVVMESECHNNGQYFHFHSLNHYFHIWYGSIVNQ